VEKTVEIQLGSIFLTEIFEVLTVARFKMAVFWVLAPRRLVEAH
jgi:hypothetical protein